MFLPVPFLLQQSLIWIRIPTWHRMKPFATTPPSLIVATRYRSQYFNGTIDTNGNNRLTMPTGKISSPPPTSITRPIPLHKLPILKLALAAADASTCEKPSNSIVIQVRPEIAVGNVLGGGQNICANVTPTLLELINQSPGTTLQWEQSFDNITFAAIAGATNAQYAFTAPLSQTTYFRAVVSTNVLTACSRSTAAVHYSTTHCRFLKQQAQSVHNPFVLAHPLCP